MTKTLDVDQARLLGTEPSTVTSSGSDNGAQAIELLLSPRKLTSGDASRSLAASVIPAELSVGRPAPRSSAQPLIANTHTMAGRNDLGDVTSLMYPESNPDSRHTSDALAVSLALEMTGNSVRTSYLGTHKLDAHRARTHVIGAPIHMVKIVSTSLAFAAAVIAVRRIIQKQGKQPLTPAPVA